MLGYEYVLQSSRGGIRPFANCSPNVLRNPAAGSPVTLCLRGFDSRMGMRHVLRLRGEVAAAAAAAGASGAAVTAALASTTGR